MASCLVAFGIFSLSTLGEDKYPACRAASEKVDYGSGLSISDGTRALIESYRTDWRSLCSSKGGSKPSLAEIFVKAKQIEADFKKVFRFLRRIHNQRSQFRFQAKRCDQ